MMDQNTTRILEEISKRSQSELIYFFIIMLIGLVVFMIPLYAIMMKGNRAKEAAEKERLEMYIKREQQLVQVVSTNTEALVSLKATQEIALNNLRTVFEAGNKDVSKNFDRIHARLDEMMKQDTELAVNLEKSITILDRAISNQQAIERNTSMILEKASSNQHTIEQNTGVILRAVDAASSTERRPNNESELNQRNGEGTLQQQG